ncbi:type VII secretion-associated protein [Nocardia sp. NPDC051833]|uniref:type VII secretion-associated protein n=1 Tax=Nocardia sp. NPDC051833 TaxID=3155674 RepID=UPI0034441B69
MGTGLVTDIDVVVSDARVLARTAARHVDVAPTVMPVPNGILVGAPTGPSQPAISALSLADSAWIGYEPQPLAIAAATDAVVDDVLAGVAPTPPGASIGVAHPSSWSTARRSSFARSFGRYSGSVALEPIAARVARLRQPLATTEFVVVVEIDPLAVTVSAVDRSRDQISVAACAHEPTLGAGDWNDDDIDRLSAMIGEVADGSKPTSVLIVGPTDDHLLERLREFAAETWTTQPTPLVQPVAFTALLLPQSGLTDDRARPIPAQNAEWVGTLRERAAATAPAPRHSTAKIIAAAAISLVVVTAGIVAVVATRDSDADAATATQSTPTTVSTAPEPMSPKPSTTQPAATPAQHTMGRVTFNIPAGWRLATGSPADRAALVPQTATPGRITVTYNTVAEQAGYDEVLRDITARISRAEPGRFGTPERDVVFAGRRGIGYQELPGDGSVVRWYVLLDHGVQTNVGCQHGSGGWGTVSTACEEVMRSVSISP